MSPRSRTCVGTRIRPYWLAGGGFPDGKTPVRGTPWAEDGDCFSDLAGGTKPLQVIAGNIEEAKKVCNPGGDFVIRVIPPKDPARNDHDGR